MKKTSRHEAAERITVMILPPTPETYAFLREQWASTGKIQEPDVRFSVAQKEVKGDDIHGISDDTDEGAITSETPQ
jgi:hypothetical protein